MKRLGIHAVALAAAFSLAACGQPDDTRQVGTTAEPGVGVGVGDHTATADRATHDFVERAMQKNMTEIELGRLAQERASDPQVRQLAEQMVEDHTASLEELRQIAQRRNIQVTEEMTDDGRRLQERLQALKGPEFDREYVRATLEGHEEMRNLMGDRAEHRTDYGPAGQQPVGTVGEHPMHGQELDQWAAGKRPLIERHHQMAQEIHQRIEKGVAGAGR
jgi:putative membrane protein